MKIEKKKAFFDNFIGLQKVKGLPIRTRQRMLCIMIKCDIETSMIMLQKTDWTIETLWKFYRKRKKI